MTNEELIRLIQEKINKASAEKSAIIVLKIHEPIDTVRWNTFVQLEKDLKSHINNLEWTLSYFEEYNVQLDWRQP